ncbi:hypothetical protein ACWEPD_26735 [Streptomyces pseudogriseolus]
MPSEKKPNKSAAQQRRIPEFEGVRSKPLRGGGARRARAEGKTERPPREKPAVSAHTDVEPLVDPRSDPEVMFRILSEKIAAKVDRAAMKAGASAAQEVSRRLTAELDAAIAGAQSAAGRMGTLVQQAVQSAVDEALRTAVLNATRVHEEHLAQLALIDRTAQTASDLDAVRLRVEQEMRRSGLTRITAADPKSFNLVNPTEHEGSTTYEVLAPAYAESGSGRIIQRGEMRRLAPDQEAPAAEEGKSR